MEFEFISHFHYLLTKDLVMALMGLPFIVDFFARYGGK